MFLCIGLFHPIVIKFEYYFGCNGWPIFLVFGIALVSLSLFFESTVLSSVFGGIGCSCFWSIKRVV